MLRTGVEPVFPAHKTGVLTVGPTELYSYVLLSQWLRPVMLKHGYSDIYRLPMTRSHRAILYCIRRYKMLRKDRLIHIKHYKKEVLRSKRILERHERVIKYKNKMCKIYGDIVKSNIKRFMSAKKHKKR